MSFCTNTDRTAIESMKCPSNIDSVEIKDLSRSQTLYHSNGESNCPVHVPNMQNLSGPLTCM